MDPEPPARPPSGPSSIGGWYRHSLGLSLLLVTVLLWTLSNFLASTLFADNTYSKPFLVTYTNSAFFVIPLFPLLAWRTCGARDAAGSPLIVRLWRELVRYRQGHARSSSSASSSCPSHPRSRDGHFRDGDEQGEQSVENVQVRTASGRHHHHHLYHHSTNNAERAPLLGHNRRSSASSVLSSPSVSSLPSVSTTDSDNFPDLFDPNATSPTTPLSLLETAKLSLSFSLLWFLANYLGSGSFEHTSVASGTILACTSGIWTLLFGVAAGVERLSSLKLVAVALSFLGVVMVSSIDISGRQVGEVPIGGEAPESATSVAGIVTSPNASVPGPDDVFGSKPAAEIALGDAMALASAVVYGIYSVMIKKKVGSEARITMPLFFGFVGLFSIVSLWPGFLIFHFLGLEPFELPPSGRVLTIILINAAASLIADLAWAYAILLLDSPLLVTIGLSLSIPLSLIGQAVFHNVRVGPFYWLGAAAVVFAFVLVDLDDPNESGRKTVSEDRGGSLLPGEGGSVPGEEDGSAWTLHLR